MYALSLHSDGSSLKIALLRRDKKKIEIELLRSFSLTEGDVKPLYILAPILAGKNARVISGLKASDLFIRELSLKLTHKRALLSALPFQIEPILPYPTEEAVLLPLFQKISKTDTGVTLFSSQHKSIETHLEAMLSLDVKPDQISCSPQALFKMGRHFFPDHKSLCIFHIGAKESLFCQIDNQRLTVSQPFKHSLECFFNALTQDTPELEPFEREALARELDATSLDSTRFPHLTALTAQFQKDLSRITAFLTQKHAFQDVLLTGEITPYFQLKTLLQQSLGATLSFLEMPSIDYAVPIGLALDALATTPDSLQFRQGKFVHQENTKRTLKRLAFYAASSLAMGALMWGAKEFVLYKKESSLAERLQHDLSSKAEGDLLDKLERLQRDLAKPKHSFPYHLTVPKAGDVLAWLSTHPCLNPTEKNERVEIKNINYALVKHPKLGETLEPYQAKVELEFTASSPRLARAFHDALIKGDAMVNPKGEITWNVEKNIYRTSFFLKPIKEK